MASEERRRAILKLAYRYKRGLGSKEEEEMTGRRFLLILVFI